jgi:phage FluMu gp28-like protein
VIAEVIRTPTESPVAFAAKVLGVTPHGGQAVWLENRARIKVACCGRRWGKSLSESIDLLWLAVTAGGTEQFLVAPTYDQAQTIFTYAETLLRNGRAASQIVKIVRSPFSEIQARGLNGKLSVIYARSAGDTGKNIRSKGADRVVWDEAAYVSPVARAAISPLLATSEHAQQVYISSPFGKNFFWELFIRGQSGDPDVASFQFPSSSSPYVQRSYLEQERLTMTARQFDVEYNANFSDDQNAVFPWSLIERCIDGELAEPQAGHRYVIGYDPAKWADRSGVIVLDVTETPWQVVAIEDIAGRDYIEAQLPAVKLLSTRYNGAAVLLDSTHNEPLLEMFRREHIPVEGFNFSNASKNELISNLVIAMEQDRLTFPNYRDLVTELTYYRFVLTVAGNVKLGADERHFDDLVTALALAVWHAGHETKGPSANRFAVSGPRQMPVITR